MLVTGIILYIFLSVSVDYGNMYPYYKSSALESVSKIITVFCEARASTKTEHKMKKKEKVSVELLQTASKNQKVSNQQPVSEKKFSLRLTGQYKRSLKRCRKRGCNERVEKVVDILAGGGQLPVKFLMHPLGGMYKGCWECHVSDDLLLVWKQDEVGRVITLIDIDSHSALFDKNRR